MVLYKDEPIIDSVLDDDAYKFFMGQTIFEHFPEVPVTLESKNRTKSVPLAKYIDQMQLREQLDHVQRLKLRDMEYRFMDDGANVKPELFSYNYLQLLKHRYLPDYEIERTPEDQYVIRSSGPWKTTTYWEIPVMKIQNALYFQAKRKEEGLSEDQVWKIGELRLLKKLKLMKEKGIAFTDFGNRRTYNPRWHRRALEIIMNEAPELLVGISNVRYAMIFGKKSAGTIAHEFYMVLANMYGDLPEQIRGSFLKVLETWWNMYGADLAIVLTDTFGSEFCFRSITKEWAELYRRLRHDSGDPFKFGDRAIAFYQGHGIDPTTATVVFSDGLDAELIVKLHEYFLGRIGTGYGWGTTLTNDMGFKTLSLVMKIVRANGLDAIKLSDNPAKVTGPAARVAYFKEVHGYVESDYVECIV